MYAMGGRWWGEGSWNCDWSHIPLCVVDCIPKTWRVHNGEPQSHTLLFYVHCMFSDLHSLHDPLWRRGKLRPGQRQGPAQSGQTAYPNQLGCPDGLIHTAPLPIPGLPGGLFSGNQQGAHFPTQEMPVAVGSGPSLSAAPGSFLGFLESFGGQRLTQRAGFWFLPCLSTQIFRELAGGLPGKISL